MSNSTPAISFWDVIRGRARLFGVAPENVSDDMPVGLIRPSLLKSSIGLGYLDSDDKAFFKEAGVTEKVMLLLRVLFCSVFGLLGRDTTGPELQSIFGVRFSAVSMREAVDRIVGCCEAPSGNPMRKVVFVNPDCLNKAYVDRRYHYELGQSHLVLPDGSGLRLAARLLGFRLRDNVNGTDLFPILCEAARDNGLRLFLLGGKPGVASAAAENIQRQVPGLKVAGTSDGYDGMQDNDSLIRRINESNADILLVGLGAPTQERWLHQNAHRLNARVGLGTGGLFDYFSGDIARAPVWLRELGLEWVWRILQEPSAKWRRYIIGNPLFLSRVLAERWTLVAGRPGLRALSAKRATANTIRNDKMPSRVRALQRRLLLASALKRLLDATVASIGLVLLSPLLLLTAAAIKLESKGPVFFAQTRVGKRGRLFTMFKFRSMYVDAEERLKELQANNESRDGVIFKMKRDPRITGVGSIIRRLSIDELPQILNILLGDMSVVGPRPALPREVALYNSEQRKRLQCKPGLTCLWQIGGRSELSFSQQVDLDLRYLSEQSFRKDIQIIVKTIPAVLSGKGAY